MARPTKERKVCRFPEVSTFVPDGKNVGQPVVLAIDEYETIRLIDNEGLSQEECATQLGGGQDYRAEHLRQRKKKDCQGVGCRLSH